MSGHSKWATTKHKKAVIDSRRAKSFAKLIKNIEVAAKIGGADMSGNPTLFDAVQKAKKTSVPNDNIDRAIKRGAGISGESVDYQTIMYEGYGPNGVALLIECLTDNKNRAAAEVRTLMTRNGGTMADPGSVAYNFHRKGVISITKADGVTEDDILLAVLDAGAEEVVDQGGGFEVITEPVAARRGAHGASGGGDRLRLGRGRVRSDPPGRGGRRHRAQGVPADRRPRGQRRRAEHLQQLRHPGRRPGRARRRRRGLAASPARRACCACSGSTPG